MSRADKWFERLGYKKYVEGDELYKGAGTVGMNEIIYCNGCSAVAFDFEYKTITKYVPKYCTFSDITLKELRAINKKCEELGWI